MEKIQRIRGWIPGVVEHSIIRETEEGIEIEGVVLEGTPDDAYAIRYALIAYPDGRCRAVTARSIGSPVLVELHTDGEGGWTDGFGVVLPELEGAVDVDLLITPVTHALAIRRLGIGVGDSVTVAVLGIDLLAGEIRLEQRRYVRLNGDDYRVEDLGTGASAELRAETSGWRLEVLPSPNDAVAS